MGVKPVFSHAHVDDDGDAERHGVHHLLPDHGSNFFTLVAMDVDDELVVDLKDELGAKLLALEGVLDPNHGDLDHVGSAALDGRVDRVALCRLGHVAVA